MSIANAKLRAIAICTETALTEGVTADGVPYFFHTQEACPYFTCRTGPALWEFGGDNFRIERRELFIRLVIAHLTDGYRGEREDQLDDLIRPIVAAFDTHTGRFLVGTTYATYPDYLAEEGVFITNDTGYRAFRNDGLGQTQIGCEFTLAVPMTRVIPD